MAGNTNDASRAPVMLSPEEVVQQLRGLRAQLALPHWSGRIADVQDLRAARARRDACHTARRAHRRDEEAEHIRPLAPQGAATRSSAHTVIHGVTR